MLLFKSFSEQSGDTWARFKNAFISSGLSGGCSIQWQINSAILVAFITSALDKKMSGPRDPDIKSHK